MCKTIGRNAMAQPDGPSPGVFHSRVRASGSVGMDAGVFRPFLGAVSDAGVNVKCLCSSLAQGVTGDRRSVLRNGDVSPRRLQAASASFTLKVQQPDVVAGV
jgi:hypothetical protein